jgi:H+/Cl- antiporter ClcA
MNYSCKNGDRIFPSFSVPNPESIRDRTSEAFAIAGMAGIVGGATGAAMAAIVMIFEMTRDYSVIIPMTVTVTISLGIRKTFSKGAFIR